MTQKEIHIAAGKDLLYIPLEEIIVVKAAGNYCDIHLANNHYDSIRIQIGQLWDLIKTSGEIITIVGYASTLIFRMIIHTSELSLSKRPQI